MGAAIHTLTHAEWSSTALWRLREIPEPPSTLYYQGTLPAPDLTLLTVVGSRRFTSYGRAAVKTLMHGLQGTPIGIVSGLAKGIDGLAHEAALDTGLYTVAVPGSGLDRSVLYPAQHRGLADRILNNGGALVSELSAHTRAAKWTFPKRNRLMAGISTATLLIEADQRSGTLITARLAADYNRDVLAVPGSIFAAQSTGTNQYISHGATPITSAADLLTQLALDTEMPRPSGTPSDEDPLTTALLSATSEAVDLDTLAHAVDRPAHELMAPLTELELAGKIQCVNGRYQRII